ncbi:serine/threonine-protein phosphatase 2A regulatory subunit B'' subunit alpha-like isoform X2 [Argiope bruennichi]|uniref:serine/threonine-protein phosphatase 2A regulatory subunit B'' subunit alpha-like isoform X2 n=1 Tax=Argiope bruennichi TaxID=94029 RepID=UPI002494759E|nr:serine/threonine-protein phosphatase 2A regulatory subunit B'' subunit alpha-like isoform X2 [Argiope bruennichi]
MLTNHVSCHYVVTSVTFYHSALVDLTCSRSVHAVEHDPCCPDPTKLSADECKAVHYGLCSPLLKLPSFSIPPATTSSPSSPATPKGTSSSPLVSSTPSPPITPKGTAPSIADLLGAAVPLSRNTSTTVSSPVLQRASSPVVSSPISVSSTKMSTPTAVVSGSNSVNTSKMDMEILDPVSLLASDLEGQLEALVNTFVAQDKVRLAARKKAETSVGSFKSTPSVNKQISPIKKYDKKIKDDRSSGDESASSLSSETSQTSKSNGFSKAKTGPKASNVISDPLGKDLKRLSPDVNPEKSAFPFDNIKNFNNFGTHFEDNLFERSSSPSFKSSILPSLKPSPEYQQTGVKAQITKFASKEKDSLQNSPTNSLERRQVQKSKPGVQEHPYSPTITQPRSGPLTLDALQELLLNSSLDPATQPIQTTVFQSSRIPSVPFGETTPLEVPQTCQADKNFITDNYVPFYVNEACKESDDLPVSIKPSTSQAIGHHSSPYGKSSQEFVQSAVDYAKNRIQSVQQSLRDESKPRTIKNGHLVSDAKTKWENIPSWNDAHLVPDIDNTLAEPFQRGGHKRTLSMDGLLDVPSPSIPHPKLTNAQKQHIKERSLSPTDRHSHVPIRPFLTKGSVAERVLLFECCPDRALERTSAGNKSKQNLISTWRPGGSDVQNKTHFWEVVADSDKTVSLSHHSGSEKDKNNVAPTSPRTSSLRRAIKSGKKDNIPRFYYKDGKPQTPQEIEAHLKKVAAVFAGLNDGKASREEFGIITKACGLPLYWKLPLFLAARGEKKSAVSCDAFLEYWRRVVNSCHDEASKFVYILSRGKRNYLVSDDFFPMMQDVIDSHPGLTFLKEATEFHSRYIHTVIARIFYCVNRSWSGKITIPELRKSNFLQVLATLEEEEDINQVTDYFSYEHFYVIYCKFWELDKDHDLYIDQNDLKLHADGALSTRIIERIFSGAVTRGPKQKEGKMSYAEFVWFLISEEDKRHPRSIEYWFRCMDLDGDGYLSMYELEYFYQEQLQRLDALGIETLPFNDCLCQMLDIIKSKVPGKIALSDLKKCKMTPIFFDTFFNLEKYLDHEQRDPFASQREHDGEGPEMSDWDRYAADEYEQLVAEEGANDPQEELYVIDFV